MRITILGAGRVGLSIARYLASDENDITIVDNNPNVLSHISEHFDVRPVLGQASHPTTLKRAGLENLDLLIAVTGSDEVNMIACDLAHHMFQVQTKIARVRESSYTVAHGDYFSAPGIRSIDAIISPETEIANTLRRSIQISGANDVIPLMQDQLKILGVRCMPGAPILNTPLRLIPSSFLDAELVIVSITRQEEFIIPDEETVLLPGDFVHLITRTPDVPAVMQYLGHNTQITQNITIIGAGAIGLRLAQLLEKSGKHTLKLIENNRQKAEYAAQVLPHAEIIHGDALDLDIITESNIQNCDVFVSITDDDKINILSALLTKKMGAKRTMTLLANTSYARYVTALGVDSLVNPRSITVSTILQHIRQGHTNSIHTFGDGQAEIIEAEVRETSHILGLSVQDITIKRRIFVVAIARHNEIILLPHKFIIGVGDKIILMTRKDHIHKVERLFSTRPSFL